MSKNYYAVHTGREPGIYHTWDECKDQVHGFTKPVYKKFNNYNDALQYMKDPNSHKTQKTMKQNTQSMQSEKKTTVTQSLQSNSMSNTVEIYTDGSCLNNGSPNAKAGIGIFFGNGDPRNVSEPLPRNLVDEDNYPTNQLAELYAISRAMEICIADASLRKLNIIIYTDSKYSINCLTRWIKTWEKNCWILASTGKPVKHQQLIKCMKMQMEQLCVAFYHVLGHTGIYGNEMADKLSCDGSSRY